ncbi:MAG: PEP/pyruvate-binding domain-containing protein, partial [Candidatus Caldarchaeum sp.]
EESWEASLSLEEAVKLAEMGASLEKYFGAAQDIEWVVDQRRKFPENIFLVQSRPVTIKSTVSTPSKQSDLNPLDRIINTLLIGVKV